MISHFQKRKKRTISANIFLGTAAFIVILLITGFLVFSNIKIKEKKDKLNIQLAAIEKEIEDFQKKNEGLKEGISRVGDEEYVEKVAREELGLQREGERVVGFILPKEQSKQGQERNFWQSDSWWKWFGEKWQWLISRF